MVKSAIWASALVCACAYSARAFEVRPRALYEATFRARVVQGPTLEKNPQLREAVPLAVSRPSILKDLHFSYVQWNFSEGPKGARHYNGAAPITLFSGEWRTFTYRFYAPDGATWAEPKVTNGKGGKAELADVTLKELPSSADLIPHPGFDDPLAAPGWQITGGALYRRDAAGAFVMMEGANVRSELFPVTPGQQFEVTITGEAPKFSATSRTNARVTYYATSDEVTAKKGGMMVMEAASVVRGMGPMGRRIYTVPAGKQWASISVWNGSVRRVEVKTK